MKEEFSLHAKSTNTQTDKTDRRTGLITLFNTLGYKEESALQAVRQILCISDLDLCLLGETFILCSLYSIHRYDLGVKGQGHIYLKPVSLWSEKRPIISCF